MAKCDCFAFNLSYYLFYIYDERWRKLLEGSPGPEVWGAFVDHVWRAAGGVWSENVGRDVLSCVLICIHSLFAQPETININTFKAI